MEGCLENDTAELAEPADEAIGPPLDLLVVGRARRVSLDLAGFDEFVGGFAPGRAYTADRSDNVADGGGQSVAQPLESGSGRVDVGVIGPEDLQSEGQNASVLLGRLSASAL